MRLLILFRHLCLSGTWVGLAPKHTHQKNMCWKRLDCVLRIWYPMWKTQPPLPVLRHPAQPHSHPRNVRGEPVFSVVAAGWFCEKSGWIGKVEDVKPVLLKKNRISTGNHFEEEDFYPDELWKMRISFGLIHLGSDIIWFEGLNH
jgi:hypothetical protein